MHKPNSFLRINSVIYIILFFCIGSLTNCTKKPAGNPGPNEIWLQYKAFNPGTISIAVGTTITFINKDNASHWVKSLGGTFDSGKITSGNSWSFKFSNAGTYDFNCNYHANVNSENGSILVQ